MKIILPVSWECCGTVEVEAESIEDAVKRFDELTEELELPSDEEYVCDSWRLSTDDIGALKLWQENI